MRVCWKSLSASFAAGGSTRAMKSAIATVLACAGSEPLGKLVFTDHRSTPFTIGLLLGMHCPQLSLPAGVEAEAGCASGVLGDVVGALVCFSGLAGPVRGATVSCAALGRPARAACPRRPSAPAPAARAPTATRAPDKGRPR